ncbi:hypothetical protein AGLY_003065 [Aphis glycines]|uniref:Uncharacterized protein n=1 Tax=Aphis glycines TaxID=307491 RepID=A0A6G0U253_APHGL|nr:hypothetical protein AGLY_003065 [Aphis glycines]
MYGNNYLNVQLMISAISKFTKIYYFSEQCCEVRYQIAICNKWYIDQIAFYVDYLRVPRIADVVWFRFKKYFCLMLPDFKSLRNSAIDSASLHFVLNASSMTYMEIDGIGTYVECRLRKQVRINNLRNMKMNFRNQWRRHALKEFRVRVKKSKYCIRNNFIILKVVKKNDDLVSYSANRKYAEVLNLALLALHTAMIGIKLLQVEKF